MKKQLQWPLIIFAVGVFMAALDNGIITSSLTTLNASFGVSPNWGAWTITLYTLGLAISVPIAGKLSDRYGRKKLFMIEVALFGLGSLLVALSPNFTLFLAARIIQALGGGGIFIIASSYVLSTFPKEKQGGALGMLGAMNGVAAVLGPNVGSLLLQLTGNWHWLFLINVPIAILLLLLGYKFIHEEQELSTAKMDWIGVSFLSLGVLGVMFSFTNLEGVSILSSMGEPGFYGYLAGGLIMLILFYYWEKRMELHGASPVISTRMLRVPAFLWTLLIAFFSGAILASVIFIPGFVEQYLGVSSTASGYWFTPLALAAGAGSVLGGMYVDRKGPIWTLTVAGLISAFGFLLFALWVDSLWEMVISSLFVGLGFSVMLGAPVNVLITEDAKDSERGIALATSSLFRQMAMAIAPTVFAGFLARSFSGFGGNIEASFAEEGIQADPAVLQQYMGETQMATTDVNSIREAFASIPDASVTDALTQALELTVNQGYSRLFWSALIFSVLTAAATLVTGKIRSKKRSQRDQSTEISNL